MPNFIDPDPAHFALLKDLPMDRVINMLNLVRFKPQADYKDGRVATGSEAYAEYGRLSAPIFHKHGGKIIWSASFEFTLIGPKDEHWDAVFVAEYPTGQAFFDMVYDPDYQAIVFHRTAAVETSRLVRLQPNVIADGGKAGFGG